MYDPMARQAANKATLQQANSIRSKMYMEGQGIEKNLHAKLTAFEKDGGKSTAFLIAIGQAISYVSMRQQLNPTIASDGLTNKLSGKVKMLMGKHFPDENNV